MRFTFEAVRNLIHLLKDSGYQFCNYNNYEKFKQPVIMRHDIDFDLHSALTIAELEHEERVCGNYFILISTSFYNIFLDDVKKIVQELIKLGHKIGVHFDESQYRIQGEKDYKKQILFEKNILENMFSVKIDQFAMHRPTKQFIQSDFLLKGMKNAYSQQFFRGFFYMSDSRMSWKQPAEDVIAQRLYDKLHILIHPIWYRDQESDMKTILLDFLNRQKQIDFDMLSANISNLGEILIKKEIS